MERHMEEQVMVRNCCLSLCQFEIPQEILFDYRLDYCNPLNIFYFQSSGYNSGKRAPTPQC